MLAKCRGTRLTRCRATSFRRSNPTRTQSSLRARLRSFSLRSDLRRRWDSNPRSLLQDTSLAVRRFRPLSHVSVYSLCSNGARLRGSVASFRSLRPRPKGIGRSFACAQDRVKCAAVHISQPRLQTRQGYHISAGKLRLIRNLVLHLAGFLHTVVL